MATAMSACRHVALGLGAADLLEMYRSMRLARLLDQRMWQMNRLGRAPFDDGALHVYATLPTGGLRG